MTAHAGAGIDTVVEAVRHIGAVYHHAGVRA